MVLISALSYQWIAGISSDSFYCWCVGGMLLIDAFHSSVIKLQSQNNGVLQILIYTRLKINKKINLCTSFLPRSMFRFESRAFSQCMRDTNFKQNYCFIEKSLFSSLDFQQSTVKPRGASLQRIPGNKVLAWDQARSDQAPHWGNKGKKKIGMSSKKKAIKEGSQQMRSLFFISPSFCLFPSMRSLVPGC